MPSKAQGWPSLGKLQSLQCHSMKASERGQSSGSKWFHVILTTYGAWLPGDPRGFRTRHHREHVEGDYKSPPPSEKYEARATLSRHLMTQSAVIFPSALRSVIGTAMLDKLSRSGALVICIAVAGQHVHFLAKMPSSKVRKLSGAAKKHVTFELRNHGWKGKVWGLRGKVIPIHDRRNQLNVFSYILRHRDEGAWIWQWTAEAK